MEEKKAFWSESGEMAENFPREQRTVIGAAFDGHVSKRKRGDKGLMGRFGV